MYANSSSAFVDKNTLSEGSCQQHQKQQQQHRRLSQKLLLFARRFVVITGNGQRNVFASQVRAQLSHELMILLGIFQRLSDGKG